MARTIMETGRLGDIDQRVFRDVLGHHPSGVVVITTLDPSGEPKGMTIDSFSSASLDPPLTMFLAGKGSTTLSSILESRRFCVNVLASDQESLARTFAARGFDKFSGVPWTLSAATGSPRLLETVAWVDCAVTHVYDAGDHEIILGQVLALGAVPERSPLLFFRGSLFGLSR